MNKVLRTSLSSIVFLLFLASLAFAASVPLHQKNPIGSGYAEFLRSLNMPDSATSRLIKIQDSSVRKAIFNASKGQCPKTFSVKNTEAKVEHAKQCGGTEKERKDRNGRRCGPSGVTGSKVEAMCVNGCCVALSATPNGAKNNFSGSNQGSYGNDSGAGQGSGSNNMFGKMFGDLFKNLMGSGGGDGGSSYNPNSYNYDSVIDNKDSVLDYDSSKDFNYWDNNDFTQEDSILDTSGTTTQNQSQSLEQQPDSMITTVLSKNGQKIEIKIDNIKDQRYAFVFKNQEQNHQNINDNNKQNKNEIMLNEVQAGKAFTSSKDEEKDPASTGFKGEKLGIIKEPGLLEKIAVWISTLLGF